MNQPTDSKRGPGRPRSQQIKVIVPIGALFLIQGEDDDLIDFFKSLPTGKRRAGLKAALRAGGMKTIRVDELSDDAELEEAAEGFLE
jgi:hypothetical protein